LDHLLKRAPARFQQLRLGGDFAYGSKQTLVTFCRTDVEQLRSAERWSH
jgi:hypothetical protein